MSERPEDANPVPEADGTAADETGIDKLAAEEAAEKPPAADKPATAEKPAPAPTSVPAPAAGSSSKLSDNQTGSAKGVRRAARTRAGRAARGASPTRPREARAQPAMARAMKDIGGRAAWAISRSIRR